MTQQTVLLLCGGGLILGLIAVVIDRLNFPQRKFRPKTVSIEPKERRASRDRTGAHIVDFDPKSKRSDPSHPVEPPAPFD